MDPNTPNDGDVPVGELRVLIGNGCGVTSCLCNKHCIGCTSEGMVTCLRWEAKGCRPVYGKNVHQTCCVLCNGGAECVKPQTCCLLQQQFCCLDSRCALPCTKEVPCICTGLPGCVCCVNYKMQFGCCKKWNELIPQEELTPSMQGSGGGNTTIINVVEQHPPQPVMMVRQPVVQQQYVVAQQQPQMLMVTVPQGVMVGQMITVQTPTGQQLQVQVPQGVFPGQQFQVQY
jgi:hypothetical protein